MSNLLVLATPEQVAVCERVGSKVAPVHPDFKVGIALSTLTQEPLHAVRLPEEAGTCGWYIYAGEYSESPDFYQPLHASHLQQHCPQIIPYLALSPGWRVLLAPSYEDVWFDETLLNGTIG